MRPTHALTALVLAASLGSEARAADLFPPSYGSTSATAPASGPAAAKPLDPPASVAPRRGLMSRLGKPGEPQVPPGPPRRPGADPAPKPPTVPPRSADAPPILGPGRSPLLRAIPTGAPAAASASASAAADAPIRRVQATPTDLGAPITPGAALPAPTSGQSLSLQQALTGALTSNPDLVALRTGNPAAASAEAVEVARRFPTTLNPTVFIDYRPITLIPNGTFANSPTTGTTPGTPTTTPTVPARRGPFYQNGQGYLLVALRQPIEWGHQTTHRYSIAKAAYSQLQWQIVQAELTALVQTYRFFQTAAYRREKLRVAERLADFNDNLMRTLEQRLQANQQGIQAADVALQRVESRATRQQAKAARQDYITALTDLRNQIGIPEAAAETEPLGEFALPGNIPAIDEQAMVQAALQSRPDLQAAQAQIAGTAAAVRLAQGDRIPTTIFGPQYVQDEAGIQYIGFNLVPTLPILNNGKPLVRQREAEQRRAVVAFQQAQQRAVAQVRAAVAKWNGATVLVNDSSGLTTALNREVDSLERLFEAGLTDLTKVTQARQRLIQLENAQLDALWAATQAQADLMTALGIPSLIHALLQAAEAGAGVASGTPPNPAAPTSAAPPLAPTPSPFAPAAGR